MIDREIEMFHHDLCDWFLPSHTLSWSFDECQMMEVLRKWIRTDFCRHRIITRSWRLFHSCSVRIWFINWGGVSLTTLLSTWSHFVSAFDLDNRRRTRNTLLNKTPDLDNIYNISREIVFILYQLTRFAVDKWTWSASRHKKATSET